MCRSDRLGTRRVLLTDVPEGIWREPSAPENIARVEAFDSIFGLAEIFCVVMAGLCALLLLERVLVFFRRDGEMDEVAEVQRSTPSPRKAA